MLSIFLKSEAAQFPFESERLPHVDASGLDVEPSLSLVPTGGIHPCAGRVVFRFSTKLAEGVIHEKIGRFHRPFPLWPVS